MSIAEFLAEQKRLAEAATEGPWRHSRLFDGVEYEDGSSSYRGGIYPNPYGSAPVFLTQSIDKRNLEFIAAARSSVPRMIAALEAVMVACNRLGVVDGDVSHPAPSYYVSVGRHVVADAVRRAVEAALGGSDDQA